jgi:hypothetical protein
MNSTYIVGNCKHCHREVIFNGEPVEVTDIINCEMCDRQLELYEEPADHFLSIPQVETGSYTLVLEWPEGTRVFFKGISEAEADRRKATAIGWNQATLTPT